MVDVVKTVAGFASTTLLSELPPGNKDAISLSMTVTAYSSVALPSKLPPRDEGSISLSSPPDEISFCSSDVSPHT